MELDQIVHCIDLLEKISDVEFSTGYSQFSLTSTLFLYCSNDVAYSRKRFYAIDKEEPHNVFTQSVLESLQNTNSGYPGFSLHYTQEDYKDLVHTLQKYFFVHDAPHVELETLSDILLAIHAPQALSEIGYTHSSAKIIINNKRVIFRIDTQSITEVEKKLQRQEDKNPFAVQLCETISHLEITPHTDHIVIGVPYNKAQSPFVVKLVKNYFSAAEE